MKINSKILFLTFFAVASLFSCKKDENQILLKSSAPPVLQSSKTSNASFALNPADKASAILDLMWSNPNYVLNTGVSSQDVTYTVEIDTMGNNFANAQEITSATKILAKSVTVEDFNKTMIKSLKLDPERYYTIELRLTASIAKSAPISSNVFKYIVKGYPLNKVIAPFTGELYLVGNATPGGWANPVPTPSQKFTKLSASKYELTVPMVGGNEFLLLPDNGSWSQKYATAKTTSVPFDKDKQGEFDYYTSGGDNLKGPTESGTYKIVVDFATGIYTITKQ